MTKTKETVLSTKTKELVSTGISSLDPLIGGGFPNGSLTLLLGELGSAHDEFLVTAASVLAARDRERALPKEVWWISFMKQPSDLVEEVVSSFHQELSESFKKNVNLYDFFFVYAKSAPYLPTQILEEMAAEERKKPRVRLLEEITKSGLPPGTVLLESLADLLIKNVPNNMVVLYTLTDLVRAYRGSEEEWRSFLLFLHWLQRSIRRWGGILYTNLMKGFLDTRMENEILSCFDNVLVFEREVLTHGIRKVVTVQKFGRLAPSSGGAAKLEIKITPYGFDVERVKVVEKLK